MLDRSPFSAIADRLEAWEFQARPSQLPPPAEDDWTTWLILSGRGWGKTRTGCEWVRSIAESAAVSRIALVAATAADARDVLVEGESGLLAIAPNNFRPNFEPTKRRLTWPNGVQASLFSSEEPERLRGPQHGAALLDELAHWRNVKTTFDNLQLGLRLGRRPRQVITTTPRPIVLLRELVKRADVRVTRGRTSENAENLAPTFLTSITSQYAGTRLARQELEGELLEDVVGALWTAETIYRARQPVTLPDLARVVVAIDPSGARSASDESADSIGIVIAGKGVDGRGYLLADRSCKLSPAGWGRRAVEAYHEFRADCIVAERNFGGAMVEHVIKTADPNVAYREVVASRGKVRRAEPISLMYEQGRISHVGDLTLLEDQLLQFAPDGYMGEGSPDRADAAIWALSELLVTTAPSFDGIIRFYAELSGQARGASACAGRG